MKQQVKTFLKGFLFMIPLFLITINVNAQEIDAYTKAKGEIIEMYGTFPTWFDAYPEYALSGAWENFKQISGAGSAIPPKYRELMKIALASQIPSKDFFGAARPGGSQVFPGFSPANELSRGRSSVAGYFDVEADVTSNFLLSGALRYEDYSDFGSTLNAKISLLVLTAWPPTA